LSDLASKRLDDFLLHFSIAALGSQIGSVSKIYPWTNDGVFLSVSLVDLEVHADTLAVVTVGICIGTYFLCIVKQNSHSSGKFTWVDMRVSIAPWWACSRFTYDKHANCGHFELLLASLRACPLFTESKHSRRIQQAYRQDGRHIRDDKIQMQAMIRSHSMRSLLTSASNQCLCPVADGNTRCLPQRRSLADTMSHHAGNCPEHSDTF
jgi:hypothetical protein